MFNIQSSDQNHACVLGLSRHLFLMLYNIPMAVGIMLRGAQVHNLCVADFN